MVLVTVVQVYEFQFIQTQNNWHGYLEDRRPAGNADPYRIIKHITDTCDGVTNGQKTGSIYDER